MCRKAYINFILVEYEHSILTVKDIIIGKSPSNGLKINNENIICVSLTKNFVFFLWYMQIFDFYNYRIITG